MYMQLIPCRSHAHGVFVPSYSLISSMLKREPRERISLRNIMSHPWMSSEGSHCCTDMSCVALVRKEHLSSHDHDSIIQVMVDGGIATRSEVLR